jgi:predicted Co/Zn/Cd cation transporter (cation efflux family)
MCGHHCRFWFASPAQRGEDLIAAGLLMLAGHVDHVEVEARVHSEVQGREVAVSDAIRSKIHEVLASLPDHAATIS